MLFGRFSAAAFTVLVIAACPAPAAAQYYDNCGCSGVVAAAPVSCCTPTQPVQTTCYQTIPVTTYTRERQTVEVPTYETAYEEREVTYYRPVTTSREVEVPYTTYQNVTEMHTVNRDMGRWVTRYHPVARCAPCQVDPRPGVIGWLNRSGYSMRTAFMPNYTTSREYCPNMVTCQIPQVRQVAVQGTRRVTVQETKMVAENKTEKVPVQRLVMKKEEVTVMRPQTAYRTVPIGTQTAWGSPFVGGTQTAWGYPIIDSRATRSALAPQPDANFDRSSSGQTTFKEDGADSTESFKRSADGTDPNVQGTGYERNTPLKEDTDSPSMEFGPSTRRATDKLMIPAVYRRDQPLTADADAPAKPVRSSGWRPARKNADRSVTGKSSSGPSVSVADSQSKD